jgi:hypothetical protein
MVMMVLIGDDVDDDNDHNDNDQIYEADDNSDLINILFSFGDVYFSAFLCPLLLVKSVSNTKLTCILPIHQRGLLQFLAPNDAHQKGGGAGVGLLPPYQSTSQGTT